MIGVLTGGSTPSQQSVNVAPWFNAESTAPARAPTADVPGPEATAEEAPEGAGAPAVPATGCGKPVPCPDRDCADCPHNTYLE